MKDKDTQLIWEAYGSDDRVSTGIGQTAEDRYDFQYRKDEREKFDDPAHRQLQQTMQVNLDNYNELVDVSKRSLEKEEVWTGSDRLEVAVDPDQVADVLRKMPDIEERGVYIVTYNVTTPEGDHVDDQVIDIVVDDREYEESNKVEFLGAVVHNAVSLKVSQVLNAKQTEHLAQTHELYIAEQLPAPSRGEPDYD